jgi:hypothetical protein
MSNATNAARQAFTRLGLAMVDNQTAGTTAGNNLTAASPRVLGRLARFTKGAASSNAVLPSLDTLDASSIIVVINDGTAAMNVFAYADAVGNSDSMNGSPAAFGAITGRVVLAAGNFGVFVAEALPSPVGGGPPAGVGNLGNWTGSIFT